MNLAKRILTTTLSAAIITAVLGCSKTEKAVSTVKVENKEESITPITLNISAAASLKDSMEEIKQMYLDEKSNVTLTYNFGSSGTLQKQIEQGAEVDIFMSAAAKQMNELESKDLLIKETRKDLLENNIVLVAPKGSTPVTDFKGLAEDKIAKIALGEPKTVPVGQYGEEVLTSLGILDKVKSKAVYGKDVKTVLSWVEAGNADAGIVYETDAKTSTKVQVIAIAPADTHKPVVYPVAVVKSSKNDEASKEFLKFLESDKAKAVFEKYGFKAYVK